MRYSSLLSVLALFIVGTSLAVSLRANYRNDLIRGEQQQSSQVRTLGAYTGENSGRLNIAGNARALLNGNLVRDGATVLPGGHLRTLAGTRASIALGQNNSVVVGEKTTTAVNFTDDWIDLKLDDGIVAVSTDAETSGVIRDSNGNKISPIQPGGVVSIPGNADLQTDHSKFGKKAAGAVIMGASSVPVWASLGRNAVLTTMLTSNNRGEANEALPPPASPAAP